MSHEYMNARGTVIGDPNPVGPPISPFNQVQNAREHLTKAAVTVSDLTARLCGSFPTAEPANPKSTATVGGVFGTVEEIASHIDRMASDIIECMERIGRQLP